MSAGVASGLAEGSRSRAWQWAVNALEKYSGVMASVAQEGRPVVGYKSYEGSFIEVGKTAFVVPINHYNATLVTNIGPVVTGVVLAYDKASGAFETSRTRYVRDDGYEH